MGEQTDENVRVPRTNQTLELCYASHSCCYYDPGELGHHTYQNLISNKMHPIHRLTSTAINHLWLHNYCAVLIQL